MQLGDMLLMPGVGLLAGAQQSVSLLQIALLEKLSFRLRKKGDFSFEVGTDLISNRKFLSSLGEMWNGDIADTDLSSTPAVLVETQLENYFNNFPQCLHPQSLLPQSPKGVTSPYRELSGVHG